MTPFKEALSNINILKIMLKNNKLNLGSLYKKLCGFNIDKDLFDFYYGNICGTIKQKNNKICLINNCEVYSEAGDLIGTYTFKQIKNFILKGSNQK